MAETKTKNKAKTKPRKAKSTAKTSRAKAPAKAKAKARKVKKAVKASPNGSSTGNGASSNGSAGIVGKAKLPLVASGAVLAGVVGGAALGAKRSGSKVLGIPMPKPKRVQFRTKDLREAAKEVGGFGEHVGDLASELRRAQEAVTSGEGNSPIEVLLHGLTKRR
jgi:hypothetical protein